MTVGAGWTALTLVGTVGNESADVCATQKTNH
jgi:hypothetical protein